MKTILAHFKKDICCLRPLLWTWGICMGIVGLAFLDRIPFSFPEKGTVYSIFALIALPLFAIQWVLLFILVVQVIQIDPLTESDAFWRTRPISGPALLAAKAMFVILLAAGMLFAAVAMKINVETGGSQMLQITTFIVGLVAFAAVTSNFPKLIGISIGFAIGGSMLAVLLFGIMKVFGKYLSLDFDMPAILSSGSQELPFFYLAGFLLVILHQYLTLKTNLSRWMLLVIFFLGTFLQGNSVITVR